MFTIVGLLPCLLVLVLSLVGIIIALVGQYSLQHNLNNMEESMEENDMEAYWDRLDRLCEARLQERRNKLLIQKQLAPTVYMEADPDPLTTQVIDYLFDLSDADLAA